MLALCTITRISFQIFVKRKNNKKNYNIHHFSKNSLKLIEYTHVWLYCFVLSKNCKILYLHLLALYDTFASSLLRKQYYTIIIANGVQNLHEIWLHCVVANTEREFVILCLLFAPHKF